MKRYMAVTIAAMVVFSAAPATAQSSGDYAAWLALVSTPVGAVPPAPALARGDGIGTSPTIVLRYGQWQFGENDDNTSNVAAGVRVRSGSTDIRFDAGLERVRDCSDCGGFMLGVDIDSPIGSRALGGGAASRAASLDVTFNPSLGFFKPSEGDGSAISLALSVPVKLSIPFGASARIAPFLAPGAGLGLIQGGGDSEAGFRTMLGGGLAIGTDNGKVQATVGFRKILLEGAPTMWGAGVSLGR